MIIQGYVPLAGPLHLSQKHLDICWVIYGAKAGAEKADKDVNGGMTNSTETCIQTSSSFKFK